MCGPRPHWFQARVLFEYYTRGVRGSISDRWQSRGLHRVLYCCVRSAYIRKHVWDGFGRHWLEGLSRYSEFCNHFSHRRGGFLSLRHNLGFRLVPRVGEFEKTLPKHSVKNYKEGTTWAQKGSFLRTEDFKHVFHTMVFLWNKCLS